jgi:hypothetical protein
MMRRIVMSSKYTLAAFVAAGLCAAGVGAQPPVPPGPPEAIELPDGDKLFVLENLPPVATMGARIDFIRSEGGVPGPVVKGKPYSARAITESTQTLADGNRITQRNEAVLYRDGEGRTRREETLTGFGQWQVGEPVTMINIYDPAAGKAYVLDAAARTAREIRPFQVAIAQAPDDVEAAKAGLATWNIAVPAPAPGVGAGSVSVSGSVAVDVDRDVTVVRTREGGQPGIRVFSGITADPAGVFPPGTTGMHEAAEDLGEQVLEGLLVKGTRMKDTIPAGTIGNERPIEIVTERWYSEQLDAMVLQRFSDPRVGETTYRLVNVVLGEPSPDLFQVPQGYAIEAPEMPRPGVRVGPPAAGGTIRFNAQRAEPAPAP